MDGEKESLAEERPNQIVAKIDEALRNYETGIGLRTHVPNQEAEQYLTMTHAELRRLSAEDCGEAAFLLANFSFHIQRCYNEEMARVTWAEEEVRKVVGATAYNYKGSSYEERKIQAIKENDYARKIDSIRSWAKTRAERLAYLSGKIEFIARTLLELQQTKRRQANTY